MPDGTQFLILLQVALQNYINNEDPWKLYTKLDTIFASCSLPARCQIHQQQPDGLCCADCDGRRTRRVGRWQMEWLENQLVSLGLESDWNSLWNGSIHDVSFLCTKPFIIFPLQQDYPTDFMSVIELDATPELILN